MTRSTNGMETQRKGRRGRWLAVTALLAAVVGAGVSPVILQAQPAEAFSALAPPPVCPTAAPICVNQPNIGFENIAATPIHVNTPTMTKETLDPGTPYSGSVTFSITDFATAPAGKSARPPKWANPIALVPLDADLTASYIFMSAESSCASRMACTYVTTSISLKPGWYTAGLAGARGLVSQDICPPSLNLVFNCFRTTSESAVYVPETADREPPKVRLNTAGAGLTTKAIAAAQDPYGQTMQLTWDFGDGTPVVPGTFGAVVSHTYVSVGAYEVTARVRTTDGRTASRGQDAGILPPRPVLLNLDKVPAPNNGVAAVASALVQGWPAGGVAYALTWSTGCPADPLSTSALNAATPSSYVALAGDGTIDIAMSYLNPTANAAVVVVSNYLSLPGRSVLAERASNCITGIGTAATTTAGTAVGATEIPVASSAVPIGNMAQIGSGTDAERRLVTGHGSLIVAALAKAHVAGEPVVDLGTPVPPYVVPGPPADPAPPTPFGGGGGGGGTPAYVGVTPARLLETRTDPGSTTVDGQGLGAGLRPAGSVTEVLVAGRAGVPSSASAAVLNVTVTGAQGPGFVTVFPCGQAQPTASSLNFSLGSTIPNGVIAKIGAGGKVCLFTSAATQLLADLNGYFPAGAAYVGVTPARLLETRTDPGSTTVDGQGLGAGLRPAGSVTEVQVAGRAGVPSSASAAVLNVTVTGAQGPGFVTVFPCGQAQPTASSLNFSLGSTIPNGVIAKIGAGGKVCLFTSAATQLLADLNGYFPAGAAYVGVTPARLLETRTDPGSTTVDGQGLGAGLRPAGSVTEVQVAGRAGVPSSASAAVLNVTVTGAQGPGFVTVFPCGQPQPTASSLNFSLGSTIPNGVIAKIGAGGKVCLFTSAATQLLADLNGYFPAS